MPVKVREIRLHLRAGVPVVVSCPLCAGNWSYILWRSSVHFYCRVIFDDHFWSPLRPYIWAYLHMHTYTQRYTHYFFSTQSPEWNSIPSISLFFLICPMEETKWNKENMAMGNFTRTRRQRRHFLLVLIVGFVLIFVCLFYFTIRTSLLSQQLLAKQHRLPLESGWGGPILQPLRHQHCRDACEPSAYCLLPFVCLFSEQMGLFAFCLNINQKSISGYVSGLR